MWEFNLVWGLNNNLKMHFSLWNIVNTVFVSCDIVSKASLYTHKTLIEWFTIQCRHRSIVFTCGIRPQAAVSTHNLFYYESARASASRMVDSIQQ